MFISSTTKVVFSVLLFSLLLLGPFACSKPGLQQTEIPSTSGAISGNVTAPAGRLENNSGKPTRTVKIYYGFWPYWITPTSYQPDWSCLTHVSYFSLEVLRGGELDDQYLGTQYYRIRDAARSQNVKAILTFTCFDQDIQDQVFAYYPRQLIDNILSSLQEYKADGVNIDIEGVREVNSFTHFSNTMLVQNFMADLYTQVKKANPDYHVAFCVMGGVEEVYRNPALSKYTDAVFLMGYDYHWSTSPVTGAVAPFGDNPDDMSIDESLRKLQEWYPRSQLILGLPFYGYDWPCSSAEPGAKTLGEGAIVYMQDALSLSAQYGRLFDKKTISPWYRYQSKGVWHQCWYDDPESLGSKFDCVKSAGIAGVGFWALGYEGIGSPVWDSLIKTLGRP